MLMRASFTALLLGLTNQVFAQEIPKTLVMRIHNETQQVEIYDSKTAIPANENSIVDLEKKKFRPIKVDEKNVNELDRDSSTNSGYGVYGGYRGPNYGFNVGYGRGYGWNFNYYYAPRYYGGYNYYPY